MGGEWVAIVAVWKRIYFGGGDRLSYPTSSHYVTHVLGCKLANNLIPNDLLNDLCV